MTYAPFTLLLLDKLGTEVTIGDQTFLEIPDSEWDRMMCRYGFDPKMEYNDPSSRYYVSRPIYENYA